MSNFTTFTELLICDSIHGEPNPLDREAEDISEVLYDAVSQAVITEREAREMKRRTPEHLDPFWEGHDR